MNIIDQLTEYGLTERESKIYLFLLKKLEASAHTIATQTNIPRATVYLTLENLKKRGLVSISRKNNVAYFQAENPNRLKKIAQDKVALTDLLIPQLKTLINTEQFSPALKLYTGKEGLKTVFEDMLETIEQKKIKRIHVITDANLLKALPKYLPEWVRRREQFGVYTQMIAESKDGRALFESNPLRETRLFPPHIAFDCSLDIYGDKVACISINDDGTEIYGAILDSATIATTLRELFFFVWESLGSERKV